MKNQGRHRHLRVDWVGEWFTVTGSGRPLTL